MSWSADQYLRFEADRSRPARDLLAAVPTREARIVVDLGCGPGNSTELLARRYPDAAIVGIDTSANMLDTARQRLPRAQFVQADIGAWAPSEAPDVIMANASLQWVPDHRALLPRLVQTLRPGGSLAVQVPDNLSEPSQALMRQVAADGPWSDRLAAAAGQRTQIHGASAYYLILKQQAARVDLWRTIYMHVLPGGVSDVVEWFKGSGLRPFLSPLSPDEQRGFLDRYATNLASAYPTLDDGSVILPFPRLFMVATR